MGTQKNRFNEMLLLSSEHPKHMLKLMGKKIFTIYAEKFCLSKPLMLQVTCVNFIFTAISSCLVLFNTLHCETTFSKVM